MIQDNLSEYVYIYNVYIYTYYYVYMFIYVHGIMLDTSFMRVIAGSPAYFV